MNKIERKHFPTVDETGVKERIQRLNSRSIKKTAKISALKMVLSMIDLTTLSGADTEDKVKRLCYKAMNLHFGADYPTVAAVCVYPSMVKYAKEMLWESNIAVASVSTAFPSGQTDLEFKLEETAYAIEAGADEIDMVISRGRFLCGDYNYVYDEVAAVKEVCKEVHLKVILETGELSTLDNVRMASEIAIMAGADFIKTSTGKISPAATAEVTLVMLETIRDHYYKSNQKIGMKPAGGIRTAKQALQYLVMVKETLGNGWLDKSLFRFGASSLANDVLMQLEKQKSGRYQSLLYFSND